jgi:hypothetical protein
VNILSHMPLPHMSLSHMSLSRITLSHFRWIVLRELYYLHPCLVGYGVFGARKNAGGTWL